MRLILIASFLFGLLIAPPAHASLNSDLDGLQQEWARIKYLLSNKDAKLKSIAELEKRAAAISAANPKSTEAKIWEAIILATDANITKSMSGLPKVERAKELLEESLKMNPRAMDGAAHMTLGSMYYQVPGWPVSFGSDKKAEEHLKKALEIDPDGMDTNYWYGAFLLEQDRPEDALTYLDRASKAPVRKGRETADGGRLKEVRDAISIARRKTSTKRQGNE